MHGQEEAQSASAEEKKYFRPLKGKLDKGILAKTDVKQSLLLALSKSKGVAVKSAEKKIYPEDRKVHVLSDVKLDGSSTQINLKDLIGNLQGKTRLKQVVGPPANSINAKTESRPLQEKEREPVMLVKVPELKVNAPHVHRPEESASILNAPPRIRKPTTANVKNLLHQKINNKIASYKKMGESLKNRMVMHSKKLESFEKSSPEKNKSIAAEAKITKSPEKKPVISAAKVEVPNISPISKKEILPKSPRSAQKVYVNRKNPIENRIEILRVPPPSADYSKNIFPPGIRVTKVSEESAKEGEVVNKNSFISIIKPLSTPEKLPQNVSTKFLNKLPSSIRIRKVSNEPEVPVVKLPPTTTMTIEQIPDVDQTANIEEIERQLKNFPLIIVPPADSFGKFNKKAAKPVIAKPPEDRKPPQEAYTTVRAPPFVKTYSRKQAEKTVNIPFKLQGEKYQTVTLTKISATNPIVHENIVENCRSLTQIKNKTGFVQLFDAEPEECPLLGFTNDEIKISRTRKDSEKDILKNCIERLRSNSVGCVEDLNNFDIESHIRADKIMKEAKTNSDATLSLNAILPKITKKENKNLQANRRASVPDLDKQKSVLSLIKRTPRAGNCDGDICEKAMSQLTKLEASMKKSVVTVSKPPILKRENKIKKLSKENPEESPTTLTTAVTMIDQVHPTVCDTQPKPLNSPSKDPSTSSVVAASPVSDIFKSSLLDMREKLTNSMNCSSSFDASSIDLVLKKLNEESFLNEIVAFAKAKIETESAHAGPSNQSSNTTNTESPAKQSLAIKEPEQIEILTPPVPKVQEVSEPTPEKIEAKLEATADTVSTANKLRKSFRPKPVLIPARSRIKPSLVARLDCDTPNLPQKVVDHSGKLEEKTIVSVSSNDSLLAIDNDDFKVPEPRIDGKPTKRVTGSALGEPTSNDSLKKSPEAMSVVATSKQEKLIEKPLEVKKPKEINNHELLEVTESTGDKLKSDSRNTGKENPETSHVQEEKFFEPTTFNDFATKRTATPKKVEKSKKSSKNLDEKKEGDLSNDNKNSEQNKSFLLQIFEKVEKESVLEEKTAVEERQAETAMVDSKKSKRKSRQPIIDCDTLKTPETEIKKSKESESIELEQALQCNELTVEPATNDIQKTAMSEQTEVTTELSKEKEVEIVEKADTHENVSSEPLITEEIKPNKSKRSKRNEEIQSAKNLVEKQSPKLATEISELAKKPSTETEIETTKKADSELSKINVHSVQSPRKSKRHEAVQSLEKCESIEKNVAKIPEMSVKPVRKNKIEDEETRQSADQSENNNLNPQSNENNNLKKPLNPTRKSKRHENVHTEVAPSTTDSNISFEPVVYPSNESETLKNTATEKIQKKDSEVLRTETSNLKSTRNSKIAESLEPKMTESTNVIDQNENQELPVQEHTTKSSRRNKKNEKLDKPTENLEEIYASKSTKEESELRPIRTRRSGKFETEMIPTENTKIMKNKTMVEPNQLQQELKQSKRTRNSTKLEVAESSKVIVQEAVKNETPTIRGAKRGRKPLAVPEKRTKRSSSNASTSDIEPLKGKKRRIIESSDDDDEPLVKLSKSPVIPTKRSKNDYECGSCSEIVPKSKWYKHQLNSHAGLTWRVDIDNPIDFSNDTRCINLMQKFKTDHGLDTLTCPKCKIESRKSGGGIYAHMRICGLTQEQMEKDKITCENCQRKITRESLATHLRSHCNGLKEKQKAEEVEMKKKPEVDVVEYSVTGRAKRQSSKRATEKLKSVLGNQEKDFDPDLYIKSNIKYLVGPIINSWQEAEKKFQPILCLYKCGHASKSVREGQEHHKNCTVSYLFHCTICKHQTDSHEEILEHVNSAHSSTDIKEFDGEDSENELFGESSESDDNDESGCEESDIQTASDDDNSVQGSCAEEGETPKQLKLKYSNSAKVQETVLQAYRDIMIKDNRENMKRPNAVTTKFIKKNFSSTALFDDFKVRKIEILSKAQRLSFEPIQKVSKKFICKLSKSYALEPTNEKEEEENWKSFKIYQSGVVNDLPIIFCGGPIRVLEWLPATSKESQILAVASASTDVFVKNSEIQPEKSLIQFWVLDKFNNQNVPRLNNPKFMYSVAIENGPVNDFKFCPSGGTTPDRLGLIAVASCCEYIQILSLPRPENSALKLAESFKAIKLQPSAILKSFENSEKILKISWSKMGGHTIIAGGYSSGKIALWNLAVTSILLRKINSNNVIELSPMRTFMAHTSNVTALALHGDHFLLTGSADRRIKVFKFDECGHEQELTSVVNKSNITCCVWPSSMGFFMYALHADFSLFQSEMRALLFNGTVLDDRNIPVLINSTSTITDMSFNEWTNMVAVSTAAGDILMYHIADYYLGPNARLKQASKMISSYTEKTVKENAETKDSRTNDEPESRLIFNDLDKDKVFKITNARFHFRNEDITQAPETRVNKIIFNPNENASNCYAIGYELGFVRFKKML